MPTKTYDVFLSHSSVDKQWVKGLKSTLRGRGVKAWMDEDAVAPGEYIVDALQRGIADSKAVALIVSPESMASGWVKQEYLSAIRLSVSEQLRLIPVLLRDAELPEFMKDRNWVDFRDESRFEQSLARLIWGITGNKGEVPSGTQLNSREVYVTRCAELVSDARVEILLSTSKLHRSAERSEAKLINDAILNARAHGTLDVRILVADGYDRLAGAIELSRQGVEVRFQSGQHVSDINFLCVDGEKILIATRVVSPSLDGYQQSDSWLELRSVRLGSILRSEFENRWNSLSTRTLREQLREIMPAILTSSSPLEVSDNLQISAEIVKQYEHPHPFIVFMVGRPGSGKTTIANQILDQVAPALGRGKLVSDLPFVRKAFTNSEGLGTRFEATGDGGFFVLDPTLYSDALRVLAKEVIKERTSCDYVLIEFARQCYVEAFDTLAQNGVVPDLIVYLDVSLETACKRNAARAAEKRGHFVSEKEMLSTYSTDDIEKIALSERAKLVRFENESELTLSANRAAEIIRRIRDCLAAIDR